MNNKKKIFLVPYSHLDTQWRWEFPTTINKYIKNTIDENIYMFDKYSEHRFNFTGALRYQMMKEYFPDKYEKVKELIEENRWHLAGTCLDETDALVPSVESSIRNILYGNRWNKKEFGKSSRDYMIPDCFGFPANLPSVLSHCGIHGFSSNKLTWGSAVGIPFELGKWRGPDGNEVVSVFNPCRYDSHLELPVYMNPGRMKHLNTLGKKNDIWKSFQYYGVGDVGGAPLEGSVKRALSSIRHYKKKGGDIVVRQGSADEFFEGITDEERNKMDSYKGDLLLINHSAGTLTSATIMKRWNRKNEQMAFAAEAAAVMAMSIAGLPYPNDKIKAAWERVVGSQMHDILPGTSTPTAYKFSQNDEALALNTWTTIIEDSARAIASYVQGEGNILIYNPLDDERHELINVVVKEADKSKTYIMKDHEGNSYPVQINTMVSGDTFATFKPLLKPFDWVRFTLQETEEIFTSSVMLVENARDFLLENKYYRVTVSKNGRVALIFDKNRNRELLKKPMAYEFQKERPKKFPAWNMDWRDRKKKPYLRIENSGHVEIIENGPLRKTLKITIKHQSSVFIKEVSLGYESNMVEFTERIDWRETGYSLKLTLNTTMKEPTFTYNWETSRTERGINRKNQFEVPSRLWVDISENDFGFSLVEDSKYGYDRPTKDTLRMTLLYTPALRYINGFWDQKSHDWGEHTIRYGIHAHDGQWTDTDRIARKFNQPVRSFEVEAKVNDAAAKQSLVHIDSKQVGLLSVKKPEDTDGILVRIYERYGKDAETTIRFASDIAEAYEVNGIEEIMSNAISNGNELSISVKANGIRSYIVKLKNQTIVAETRQKEVKLDYNDQLIGSNGEKGTALFPREMTPEKVHAGPVILNLAKSEKLNALECRGQSIAIPSGYNTLSILGGSYNRVNEAFRWLDSAGEVIERVETDILSMTGFIAQWDTRTWKKDPTYYLYNRRDYAWINKCTGITPGYVNRGRVEWYSSHTHSNGEDRAYRYGYMHSITFDIPIGAIALIVPDNKDVKILSMAVSQQNASVVITQYLNDKYDY